MNRSPGPIFSFAGKQTATTSTSAQVVFTRSLSRSPSRVRGRCRPGVSTRISWASGRCTMPRTTVRVVCGLSEVIATLVPTSALVSVDLPAFGRPDERREAAAGSPVAHAVALRLVVLGPDLLVGLARRLAGAPDRPRVDGARLAPADAAPVAHHVVRRGRQPAVPHQVLADRPHLRGLPRHPEVALARRASRGPRRPRPAGCRPSGGSSQVTSARPGGSRAGSSGDLRPDPGRHVDGLGDPGHRRHRVRSPTSISHPASAGIANEPFGSVIVTGSPTQSRGRPTR